MHLEASLALLLFKLLDVGSNASLALLGQGEALNDLDNTVVADTGEGEDETLGHPVRTIRRKGHGDPLTLRSTKGPVANVVDSSLGGGSSRGLATSLDDGTTTESNSLDEGLLEPCVVIDCRTDGGDVALRRIVNDNAMSDIGEHGVGVVTPDDSVLDTVGANLELGSELCGGAVVVKASHGVELLRRNIGSIAHRDVSVGVRGVTDDKHLDGLLSIVVDGLTLTSEDGSVGLEEVSAVHTRATGLRTDEQCNVSIGEGGLVVSGADDLGDEGVGAINNLHSNTLEVVGHLGDIQKAELDRLVSTQHLTLSNHEDDGVCDVTAGTSDDNNSRILRAGSVVRIGKLTGVGLCQQTRLASESFESKLSSSDGHVSWMLDSGWVSRRVCVRLRESQRRMGDPRE